MSLENLGFPARGSDGGVDADLFALVHGDAPFRPQATEIAQRPYVKRMERYRREWIEYGFCCIHCCIGQRAKG